MLLIAASFFYAVFNGNTGMWRYCGSWSRLGSVTPLAQQDRALVRSPLAQHRQNLLYHSKSLTCTQVC